MSKRLDELKVEVDKAFKAYRGADDGHMNPKDVRWFENKWFRLQRKYDKLAAKEKVEKAGSNALN